MAHFSVAMLLVLAFYSTFSSAAAADLSLQDKLQELEIKLEANVAKVNNLETQLQLNSELRKDLTLKLTQLEVKVQEQENILSFLLQAGELPTSATDSKLFRETPIQLTGKSGTSRTCRELHAADPTLPSGMQWIDPDGQGVGDSPIYVYCDMKTESTSILHDSELRIDVGHCNDPGCYSRAINYSNASLKQMKSLIELSAECQQRIKYDCYYAPFEFNKVAYSWWNDRDGNAQYFWAGNNTDGIHTCQCGISKNCIDNSLNCNCDVTVQIQLADDGFITDKNVLPVTRLNFGRTQLNISSGVHTLGRLECTGSAALTGFPTSCEDLWLIGHTLNGFYSVMGSAMMESVYCDFNKLPSDAGFQKWIGYTDVKSMPAYFYVQRNSTFTTTGTPIPFNLEVVNEGNAMNLTTGIFTASRMGMYLFSFTGLARFPASSYRVWLNVDLILNGNLIGEGRAEDANTLVNGLRTLTLESTLNLEEGDQIWVQISEGTSSGVILYDDDNHNTHFTGFMLEEEIAASL